MADYYAGPSASTTEAMFELEPSSADLYVGTRMGFYSDDITSLTLNMEALGYALIIDGMESLVTASFPNLLSVDEDLANESQIVDCTALTSISLPKLETVDGTLAVGECPNLESIDLSSLVSANGLYIEGAAITTLDLGSLVTSGDITISGGTNLSSIDLSSLVPATGGSFDFSWNALTATSVNAILARFVANAEFVTGTIALNEGTNAAPTGQGLTDVTTLRARGVTVTVNE